MKKAALHSIGCKTNQYEIEALGEALVQRGYELVPFSQKADIYIVNTCTVTVEAARKSRQMIRRAQGRDAVICVMGCYSELNREETARFDDVYIIAGTGNRSGILAFLDDIEEKKEKCHIYSDTSKYEELPISGFQDKTRAYIKIEDGCDNFCSYCIIPYARGGVRSREYSQIICEAERLAKNGYREIVLTGTNISKYSYEGVSLTKLLKMLDPIEGIDRIRLGSVYPDHLDKKTIDELADVEKLCRHFHVSLQSAADDVLAAMGRKYDQRQAENSLSYLLEKMDDVIFTGDVIVGFPGEKDPDFDETCRFIEKFPFYHVHVFKYSAVKGTTAAVMKETVAPQTKNCRSRVLVELSERKKKEVILALKGKSFPCLFEKKVRGSKNTYQGHTDNYIDIYCDGEDLVNKIMDVVITGHEAGIARAVLK